MSYDVMDCQLLSATLLVMLVICAWTDWKQDRVPNAVTIPGILAGLAGWCWWQGVDGFVYSACSAAVMLIVLLLAYATGGMGGGDVKLMAALALFLGPGRSAVCLLVACVAALVGAAGAALCRRGAAGEPTPGGVAPAPAGTFPFAPALAIGAAVALLTPAAGLLFGP